MLIIGLSGKAENGKTWVANELKNLLEKDGYRSVIQPLAKRMKEQAKLLGWNGEKDEKGRRLLQEISWPVKHYHGEDIYAKWCIADAKQALEGNEEELSKSVILIDDVRMMAEINYTKASGEDYRLIRVTRPGWVSKLTPEQLKDVSETQLDNFKEFDYHITNPGIEKEGKEVVKTFYEENIRPILEEKVKEFEANHNR